MKKVGAGFVVLGIFAATMPVNAKAARYESNDVFKLDYRDTPVKKLQLDDEKTPAEYWRATGLTIQNYFDDIVEHCYDSLKSFRGCYEGLSDVAGASKAGAVIIGTAAEKAAGHPNMGDEVEALSNNLKLFAVKKVQARDNLEIKQLRAKIRAIHQKATEALFAAQPRIDFQSLIRTLSDRSLVGEKRAANEAWYAATLYNEYLGATDDPHSRLSPTEEEIQEFSGQGQRFFGVGIQTTNKEGHLKVYRVFRNSPAQKYGLHRNDEIVLIDGKSPAGMTDAQITQMIRGAEGTQLQLKVKRAAGEVSLVITRGAVVRANVETYMVADTGAPVGYIRLGDFMDEQASVKIERAIADFEAQGAKGLILDLRDNGGGLLQQAYEISELFVGKKSILSVMDLASGRKQTFGGSKDPKTHLPLAVLIDAGSASASEITAGALQDNNRGWIVGDRSFGKGSVQGISRFNFKSYAGNRGFFDVSDTRAPIRYRKTVQRFYQPSGRTNQIQGIIPSFVVDPFPGATEADKTEFREEDYYENALPAIDRPWKETRVGEVAQINNCRDQAKAEQWYKGSVDSDVGIDPPDYRLYAAQDVVRCHVQTQGLELTQQ